MQQLSLDLVQPATPSLLNFVAGPNAEALERISAIARGERDFRLVYLWGESGTGKTHLLRALGGRALGPNADVTAFDASIAALRIVTVDDCDQLDASQQAALFHLFNRVLAQPDTAIVCAGASAPLALAVRDDLRTRLGYGLVLRLQPLPDQALRQALEQLLRESGTPFAADLIEHLLRHRPRDLRSLLVLLHALDRYGLERQRPLTVPLLREFENRSTVKLQTP